MRKSLWKMKVFLALTLGLAFTGTTFASTITDISTGTADWQVSMGAVGPMAAVSVSPNGSWAPAPTGSSWVSWGANESTSCVVGQTPGNGCAHTLTNPAGDIWTYDLTITAAQLGATSGSLNFVFGSDDLVNLFVGLGSTAQMWNGGGGFNPLGCSNSSGPTSAGNTQTSYALCVTSVTFGPANLNLDGSLTLMAQSFNNPIGGCPGCGDPTGFVLEGDIVTSTVVAPEPSSVALMLLGVGLVFVMRKRIGQRLPQAN